MILVVGWKYKVHSERWIIFYWFSSYAWAVRQTAANGAMGNSCQLTREFWIVSPFKLSKWSWWEIHDLGLNQAEMSIDCQSQCHLQKTIFNLKVLISIPSFLRGDWELMMWDPLSLLHGDTFKINQTSKNWY